MFLYLINFYLIKYFLLIFCSSLIVPKDLLVLWRKADFLEEVSF